MSYKIKLVLLYCGVRTGHFGAGSHIAALFPYLSNNKNFDFLVVKTDDKTAIQVFEDYEEGVPVLHIPQPENKLYLTNEDSIIQKTYAKRIVEIILPFLGKHGLNNIIFLVNSSDYLNVCKEIKETCECKIVYVHHSWRWKHIINVSDDLFSSYLTDDSHALPARFSQTDLKELIWYQLSMATLADHVVTVTKQARDFFFKSLKVDQNKITNIYNGVDFSRKPSFDKRQIRNDLGLSMKDKIVLFTGRVTEDKGVGYLIEAYKLLATEISNIRLIVVGGGDIGNFIPRVAPFWNRVTFTGEISNDDVRKFYSAADVGVLPSLHEQCSFTTLEMRYYGLPIVVSALDGLDETFEHEFDSLKIGVHVDDCEQRILQSEELADCIRRILKNNKLARELGKNAWNTGVNNYSIQEMWRKYEQVFLSQTYYKN